MLQGHSLQDDNLHSFRDPAGNLREKKTVKQWSRNRFWPQLPLCIQWLVFEKTRQNEEDAAECGHDPG